jgi:hypothetical protein
MPTEHLFDPRGHFTDLITTADLSTVGTFATLPLRLDFVAKILVSNALMAKFLSLQPVEIIRMQSSASSPYINNFKY